MNNIHKLYGEQPNNILSGQSRNQALDHLDANEI